jgi:hypothetical protein
MVPIALSSAVTLHKEKERKGKGRHLKAARRRKEGQGKRRQGYVRRVCTSTMYRYSGFPPKEK